MERLRALIAADRRRMGVLYAVRDLGLPDCWVAAGFVRNCVWDHLHGLAASPLSDDIDVIWFDAADRDATRDAALEAALKANHVDYQHFVYPGVEHGFNNDTTPRYDEGAAKLAWGRTMAFFKAKLG